MARNYCSCVFPHGSSAVGMACSADQSMINMKRPGYMIQRYCPVICVGGVGDIKVRLTCAFCACVELCDIKVWLTPVLCV